MYTPPPMGSSSRIKRSWNSRCGDGTPTYLPPSQDIPLNCWVTSSLLSLLVKRRKGTLFKCLVRWLNLCLFSTLVHCQVRILTCHVRGTFLDLSGYPPSTYVSLYMCLNGHVRPSMYPTDICLSSTSSRLRGHERGIGSYTL